MNTRGNKNAQESEESSNNSIKVYFEETNLKQEAKYNWEANKNSE